MNNFKRAMTVIKQIKAGKFIACLQSDEGAPAITNGKILIWMANGGSHCEGMDANYKEVAIFGMFWRHVVWHYAKKVVKAAEKKYKQDRINNFFK